MSPWPLQAPFPLSLRGGQSSTFVTSTKCGDLAQKKHHEAHLPRSAIFHTPVALELALRSPFFSSFGDVPARSEEAVAEAPVVSVDIVLRGLAGPMDGVCDLYMKHSIRIV